MIAYEDDVFLLPRDLFNVTIQNHLGQSHELRKLSGIATACKNDNIQKEGNPELPTYEIATKHYLRRT